MKIIVLSDTHMPKKAKGLPFELTRSLEKADHILHLGDWQTLHVYEELKKYAPIDGVSGNVDGEEIIKHFGYKKTLTFQGYTFGLIHGHQGKGRTTEDRAVRAFDNEAVDVILFGHSHIPIMKKTEKFTLFNPGSPTDKRRQPLYSFGVIEILDTLSFQHIFYKEKHISLNQSGKLLN
jgi:putative phosphoesterase